MNIATVENNVRRCHVIDVALLICRFILGAIFIAHGSQKLFGAFGGPGLEKWVEMVGTIGYLVAIGEFFGSIGLIVGLFSRLSALGIVVIMSGALITVHVKNGFFVTDNGFEYVMALIGLALTILLAGPGRLALVRLLPYRSPIIE